MRWQFEFLHYTRIDVVRSEHFSSVEQTIRNYAKTVYFPGEVVYNVTLEHETTTVISPAARCYKSITVSLGRLNRAADLIIDIVIIVLSVAKRIRINVASRYSNV